MYIKEGITCVENHDDIIEIVKEIDRTKYNPNNYISFEELKIKFNYGGSPRAKIRN